VIQCIPRHLQLTIVESALCCPCLELLFSLGSQTLRQPVLSAHLVHFLVLLSQEQVPSLHIQHLPNRLRFTLQQKIALAAQPPSSMAVSATSVPASSLTTLVLSALACPLTDSSSTRHGMEKNAIPATTHEKFSWK
jgi:hypothetical protein